MPEPWYERVAANAPLMQGDFIIDCPLLAWRAERPVYQGHAEIEQLTQAREILREDVVVMTQACDLEQRKINEVVVCPIYPLTAFKTCWEDRLRSLQQKPSDRAWRNSQR